MTWKSIDNVYVSTLFATCPFFLTHDCSLICISKYCVLKVITISLLSFLLSFFFLARLILSIKDNSQFKNQNHLLMFYKRLMRKVVLKRFILFYEEAVFQNLTRDLKRIYFEGKGCHKDS